MAGCSEVIRVIAGVTRGFGDGGVYDQRVEITTRTRLIKCDGKNGNAEVGFPLGMKRVAEPRCSFCNTRDALKWSKQGVDKKTNLNRLQSFVV